MILKGEITCWSLSGIEGLKEAGYEKNYKYTLACNSDDYSLLR